MVSKLQQGVPVPLLLLQVQLHVLPNADDQLLQRHFPAADRWLGALQERDRQRLQHFGLAFQQFHLLQSSLGLGRRESTAVLHYRPGSGLFG